MKNFENEGKKNLCSYLPISIFKMVEEYCYVNRISKAEFLKNLINKFFEKEKEEKNVFKNWKNSKVKDWEALL